MKTKRKIRLSGQWWHPIREFEFVINKPLEDVVSDIQEMHNPKWFGRSTKVVFNRKNRDGEHTFLIRTLEPRSNAYFVRGVLEEIDTATIICGKAGIGNRSLLVFCILLSSISLWTVGMMLSGIFWVILFLLWSVLILGISYRILSRNAEAHFNKFVDEVNFEREKQA